jgi:hypothetical protein
MRRMLGLAIMILVLVAAGAGTAHAQMGAFRGYATAHVGGIVGGELNDGRAAVGGSISVNEDTGWGAEFDLGHSSDARVGRQILDITSYMFNAVWIRPSGLVRPFGAMGGGVLQVNGCDSPCNQSARTHDFGVSAGGGAYVALNEMAALRADARYFFSSADHADLRRPSKMNFWRISFGATFMWAVAP